MAAVVTALTESVESAERTVQVPLEPPGSMAPVLVRATAASAAVAVSTASESAASAPVTEAAPPSSAVVVPSDDALDATELDASKLHCYQVALELHSLCSTLVASFSNRIVRDQLERASLSVVLNIAEGGGRRSRRDKARFYGRPAMGVDRAFGSIGSVETARHRWRARCVRGGDPVQGARQADESLHAAGAFRQCGGSPSYAIGFRTGWRCCSGSRCSILNGASSGPSPLRPLGASIAFRCAGSTPRNASAGVAPRSPSCGRMQT
jgi:hypothetical protein